MGCIFFHYQTGFKNMTAQPVQYVKDNTDTKVVVSTVIGMGLFGLIIWAAVKSGVKPLAAAARAVK